MCNECGFECWFEYVFRTPHEWPFYNTANAPHEWPFYNTANTPFIANNGPSIPIPNDAIPTNNANSQINDCNVIFIKNPLNIS